MKRITNNPLKEVLTSVPALHWPRMAFCFLLFACCLSSFAQQGDYQLVWHDEFNNDGRLDERDWSYEEGFVRNYELQLYVPQNAVCRDGCLVIEGRKERMENPAYQRYHEFMKRQPMRQQGSAQQARPQRNGRGARSEQNDWRMAQWAHYTSSSVITRGKHEFLFGRLEVRARIPVASGSWPAIWTLGTGRPWVECGEIDMMEFYRIKGVPTILANVARADSKGEWWNTQRIPFTHFTAKDQEWSQKFHIWRMDWDSTAIRLYLDDELLNETFLKDTWNKRGELPYNPFLHPQYLLLNLALGAQGGEPDTTAFPLRYEIDYVRVYQTAAQREAQWGRQGSFNSGRVWLDTQGRAINAHGGGILQKDGRYWWFGEYKSPEAANALVGVTCYSSDDLLNWKNEGIALAVDTVAGSPIERGCIMERPKVVYNDKTHKYVMWFHLELKGRGYDAAQAAVAVADRVQGPYRLVWAGRPNAGKRPVNVDAQEWEKMQARFATLNPREVTGNDEKEGFYAVRDFAGGQMSRDQTLFVDDDGRAYRIFSSEENRTLDIAEMSDDYTSHTGRWIRVAAGGMNEAPALFKHGGLYWLITSGCTGWAPNRARMFSAPSIWGPWTSYSSPCRGEGADNTFGAQSTYVLPVTRNGNTTYIFMADRWNERQLGDSRYVWLPISFDNNGVPVIEWKEQWTIGGE